MPEAAPAPIQPHEHTFCDTKASVDAALSIIRQYTTLAFDCEGRDLGETGGRLSLISLRTISDDVSSCFSAGHTFLFDTIALKRKYLLGVYAILESSAIKKVVFDGRKDFSSLYHDRGVELRNVIDLQIADIKSRALRGEQNKGRMKRLEVAVDVRQLKRNPHLFVGMHKLNGLKNCAKEHIAFKAASGPRFDHSMWVTRPLPAEYLHHATEDVVLIHQLYIQFLFCGWLFDGYLPSESMRYVSIWKDRRPLENEPFRNHGLLPFGIIDAAQTLGQELQRCAYCERALTKSCFPKNSQSRKCNVCRAVEFPPFWVRRKREAKA
ncbi:hypothetical protein H0H81_009035 [Sphagnurus paluster]|uniref:3'-5' exonuclease domain-containing protein n=1 Tax=Sphagnurus paluster TaxID=117069 RepID=A0A9P7FQ59_9AGAR|nr:hypothetical protein H0H81_009035 [Sphagnurus paluster]